MDQNGKYRVVVEFDASHDEFSDNVQEAAANLVRKAADKIEQGYFAPALIAQGTAALALTGVNGFKVGTVRVELITKIKP